ncbi:MAG: copper chaperone PCu(A)C [Pseudomonadota bacterium]
MRSVLTALSILLAGAAFASDTEPSHDQDAHKAEAGGVVILHPWAQATTGTFVRIYMEIENENHDAVTLMGGDAHGVAESVLVYAAPVKPGAAPKAIGDLVIAEESHMELTPGGVYLQLDGLKHPLAKGDRFEMHVEIAPIGEMEVIVEVEAANATQHSHAGHAH